MTQPPAVAFATAGQPTSLSISAEGSALTYQWRRFGAAIAGATAATLRLEYVAMTDAGSYDVVVTSGAARVTSNATRLEVRPAVLPGAVGPRTGFPAAIEGEKGAEARGIAMAGDGALVFGSYTTVNGLPYTGLVRLTTTGQVDTNFQPPVFSGDIVRAARQTDGKYLLVGSITIASPPLYGLVRLNTDGSIDQSYAPFRTASSYFTSFAAAADGRVVVAQFPRLSRYNSNGTLDTSFNATVDNSVNAIAIQPDGKVIIGGSFLKVNGVSRSAVARLNSDGGVDASFAAGTVFSAYGATPGSVRSLALLPDGKIVAIGDFLTVSGVPKERIARLNADGSLDNGFTVGTEIPLILDFVPLANGKYMLAVNAAKGRDTIVRMNADGSIDPTFRPGPEFEKILANNIVVQSDGTIVARGAIPTALGMDSVVRRLDGAGNVDPAYAPSFGFSASVSDIAPTTDGKWLITGTFSYIGGESRKGIARLNADGSVDRSFSPGAGFYWGVGAPAWPDALLVQSDGRIVVEGRFNRYDGTDRINVLRLLPNGALDTSFDMKSEFVNSQPYSGLVQQPDGKILAIGSFAVARFGLDGVIDRTFAPTFNAPVTALAVQGDGRVLVGVHGLYQNSTIVRGLARFHLDGRLDTTFSVGSGVLTSVGLGVIKPKALVIQPDGKILAGGDFSGFNGVINARYIVRLEPDGSVDRSFSLGSGFDAPVSAILLEGNGKVLVTGSFTSYNGTACNAVARLNGDGHWIRAWCR